MKIVVDKFKNASIIYDESMHADFELDSLPERPSPESRLFGSVERKTVWWEHPPEPREPTDLERAQQDITDLQLADIERGQEITDIQIAMLEVQK